METDEQQMELFVCGRLCLFGEHSDWAGAFKSENAAITPGRTIVVGTSQGLHARVTRLATPHLNLTVVTDDGHTAGTVMDLQDHESLVNIAQQGGFWSYIAGTAYRIVTDFELAGCGLVINNHTTTLPLKKGLSSSAAICVLVARAFNRLFNLRLSTRGEMQYAYEGERLTPSRCGKMDQALAFGCRPVLMTYKGDVLHISPLQLRVPLYIVLVDLKAAKDTVTILSALQAAYPFARTPAHEGLHRLLGPINADITATAVTLLQEGDVPALGRLMTTAQQHFDDLAAPLCPQQLHAPVLHTVLQHPAIQPYILGGKGVGSQGDGTAQLLCRDQAAQDAVCRMLEAELGVHCLPLTMAATHGVLQLAAEEGPGVKEEPSSPPPQAIRVLASS